MDHLQDVIKNINQDTLDKVQQFINSRQGKHVVEQLQKVDKDALMSKLGSITHAEEDAIRQQLDKNADMVEKLKGMLEK